MYMVYTIVLVIGLQGQLLLWDYLYFVGELVIILLIIMQEIRFSQN